LNLNFIYSFSKKDFDSMKFRPVGSRFCPMRTDRRTDMTKLIVAFHSFVNAPTKSWVRFPYCATKCAFGRLVPAGSCLQRLFPNRTLCIGIARSERQRASKIRSSRAHLVGPALNDCKVGEKRGVGELFYLCTPSVARINYDR